MGDRTGRFVWRELMTNDVDASSRFYGELFGWKIDPAPAHEGATSHRLILADGKQIGDIMPMIGVPAHWTSYVGVHDVDAAASRATEAGGNVVVAPTDIPGVGRFAVLGDGQGAKITAFRDQGAAQPMDRPGLWEFCWEQLNAANAERATEFYARVFDWKAETSDTGLGVFTVGTTQVATLLQAPPGVTSHWITYVVVPKLGEARDRAKRLGGKVYVEEMPVPGMGRISILGDNVGAVLGIFEADL